jgi:ferredoxin--NADP+ reductase
MATDIYNATLTERRDLSADLAIVHVRPDSGQVPAFVPGQYTLIGLVSAGECRTNGSPRLVRRAYSIASAPHEHEALEFYIVRVREGRLTPDLWSVPAGGRLWLDRRCHGHFTLAGVPRGKDLIFVATGTGLAPYISMLRSYLAQGRWRRLVILHGVRLAADLGYRREIEAARREDPSIVYLPTVTREPADSGWSGLRGRLQDFLVPGVFARLSGVPLDPSRSYVLLCGNPDMIRSASRQLQALGFAPRSHNTLGSMHYEKYW